MKNSPKNRFNRFLELSLSLAKTNFKLRNEGSFVGILWYLLNPLLLFIPIFLIFADRLGSNIPYYPLYLLLGMIMFNFFQSATVEASTSIIYNASFVKSLKFPIHSLIGSVVLKTFFSHIFELILFCISLFIFGIPVYRIMFYPLIFLFLFLFSYGISLFLSALTVYFVDVGNVWSFASRIIWFITPIFYAIEGQTRLFLVNLFNPLYYFITFAREMIIYARFPAWWIFAGVLGYTFLSLLIGILVFNKLKPNFAEKI